MQYDETTGLYYVDAVSEQKTRSGKNEFNSSLFSNATTNGVTLTKNNDGTVTLNGTSTALTDFNIIDLFFINAGSNTIASITKLSGSFTNNNNSNISVEWNISDASWGNRIYTNLDNLNYNPATGAKMTNGIVYTKCTLRVQANVTCTNLTLGLQIEKGSLTPFEQYGASPSPEYPSEIINKYKAGENYFTINDREYLVVLNDDLRQVKDVSDRLWLNIEEMTAYVEKKTAKVIFDGSENITRNPTYDTHYRYTIYLELNNNIVYSTSNNAEPNILSNRFKAIRPNYTWGNAYIPKLTGISLNTGLNTSNRLTPFFISYESTETETLQLFKEWLANNNVEVFYQLAEYEIEDVIAVKENKKLAVLFDDKQIDDIAYMEVTNSYKLFTNKNFALGSTASNTYSLKLNKNYAYSPKKVEIEEYLKRRALLYVDKIEDNAKEYFDYSLTDAMVNFEFKYDASLIFVDGKTTVKKILENICSIAGIRLATTDFIGQDLEVSWYDNTVTARTYIGYIAELNGGFARINNNGELELVQFKNNSKATINLDDCEEYTLGEYHKITRVIFDNGILVSSFGDDTGNTLYLNTSNFFINDEETVEQIYNSIKDFEFYSFSAKKFPYVEVMAGDIVTFTDGENNYQVIAQYELEYFGTWFGSLETEIQSLKQEETRVISEQEKYNRLLIEQNRAKGEIKILAETSEQIKNDLDETNLNISNNYYNKQQAEQLVLNSATGLTNTFSEAGGNNILKNTNFSASEVLEEGQKYEYWFGNVIRNSNNSSVNGYSILLQNGNLNQEEIVANGNYTLSFYYKKLNPLANVYVVVNGKKYELTSDEITLFQTGLKADDGTYLIDPISVSDNHFKVEFVTDIDNSCEVYDIMANYGTIKLAYSQNANETTTDTVNISKGITIISSTSEVKFTANNDGVRTKTKNDEVITDFTDKGMNTKEAVIENEATIVGVLRQRVGEQVWDSLI